MHEYPQIMSPCLEIPLVSLLGTHHVIMFMQRSAWRRLRRLKTRDLKTVSGYGWTSGRLPQTECDRSHHRPAVLCCYYRTTVTWHPPCVTLRHVQLSFTLNILSIEHRVSQKMLPYTFSMTPSWHILLWQYTTSYVRRYNHVTIFTIEVCSK